MPDGDDSSRHAAPPSERRALSVLLQAGTAIAGFVLALLSLLFPYILNLPADEPLVHFGSIAAFGVFLGIVGWSAALGGLAYFLLFAMLSYEVFADAGAMAAAGALGLGLRLAISVRRRRRLSPTRPRSDDGPRPV